MIIDCATAGVSGDKILAAAVHAGGRDLRIKMEGAIKSIIGDGVFSFEEAEANGLRGLRAVHDIHGRKYNGDLVEAVKLASLKVGLSVWGLDIATKAAELIIEAEREVHGGSALHELGEIDTIVDIVGTIKALEELRLEGAEFFTTPLRGGVGHIRSGHGILPIPAPATLHIIQRGGMPILLSPENYEYTTPTGAAIVAALTFGKVAPPAFRVNRIGLGVGTLKLNVPNITRIIIGEGDGLLEKVWVVETNVDDVSGEILGWLWDRLKGVAEDVSFVPIFMKKSRPGFTVRVAARPELKDEVVKVVMEETGTLGVKVFECERVKASREIFEETVKIDGTEYKVRVKRSKTPSRLKPEFDDLKKIALSEGRSLREVMEEVIRQVEEKYQEGSRKK
ncbi:MAG: nickel pincer cofactor biosynthesis protein LarC [Candidatus Methanomethyliaceae archaeon]|nr:nickel pincer cofactor biosynthesis protein LarC [Candidatus Methanomethyliaceae archaeon]